MPFIYIIPFIGYAEIRDNDTDQARTVAQKFCMEHGAEYLEENLHSVGPLYLVYSKELTPAQKAIEFLKSLTIDKMSAFVSLRMYSTIEEQAKNKNVFEILTDYNAYRNGIWTNFGQKSIHELVTVLYNLYGISVPEVYFYKGHQKIEITTDNVLDFFKDKPKFK